MNRITAILSQCPAERTARTSYSPFDDLISGIPRCPESLPLTTFGNVSQPEVDLKDVQGMVFQGNALELHLKNNSRKTLQFPHRQAMMQALKDWADHTLRSEEQRDVAEALRACRAELNR